MAVVARTEAQRRRLSKQKPPMKWSEIGKRPVEELRFRVAVTALSIVVGDQVFLATADHARQIQSVLCFDRKTGKQIWQTVVHRGNFEKKGNSKASLASSTVACDGKRLFINFLNNGAVYTTALSRQGKQLWQTKITDYVIHQGYGSSPAVYRSLVIVSADNKGGGAIAGLERATGKVVWKQQRPKFPNYSSPIILNVDGRDQLFLTGCNRVSSFDPMTGKVLWEIKGATTECVTSTVTDGQNIFTSGGYPKNHVSAVRADGSGKIIWENGSRVYVPSMLVLDGYLYGVLDAGMAVCWKADTGKEVWKGRLRGIFTAFAGAGGREYLRHERNRTDVHLRRHAQSLHADRREPSFLATRCWPRRSFCGNRIYLRVANKSEDKRQEMLYCVGQSK